MARLVGVDLPRNKRLEIALTYIYGIGPARSKKILEKTKTKNIKNVLILTIDGNGKVYFQAKKGNYQTFTYPYSKVVI